MGFFLDKLLGQLLQLNLTEWEESLLEAYLRARPEPHALEPLLLYYLHRSRFAQAFRLNQDMNAQDKVGARALVSWLTCVGQAHLDRVHHRC